VVYFIDHVSCRACLPARAGGLTQVDQTIGSVEPIDARALRWSRRIYGEFDAAPSGSGLDGAQAGGSAWLRCALRMSGEVEQLDVAEALGLARAHRDPMRGGSPRSTAVHEVANAAHAGVASAAAI
jgi:hypothetical protein